MQQRKIKPVTDNERALLAMPSIQSAFPIEFENGSGVEMFSGYCACCSKEMPANSVCGRVTRPTKQVIVMEAMGVCDQCNVATHFFWRIYDDMRLSTIKGGRWVTIEAKTSLFQRALGWFKHWFLGWKI